MGDNRENYCHTKCKFLDNKGIALITTIILIAAILIISGAMLYLITRGIRSSGEFQRYETVQAAAEGGIEIGTYILENFEDVFYRLKQEEPDFYNDNDIPLQLGRDYADNITFYKIEDCKITGDTNTNANSGDGVYLDRYLIGLNPDNNDYEECQEAVWRKPFITIKPKDQEKAPYSEINIYIRKEHQGPTPGAGGSASLTAPSSASGGLGSAGYLLSIRSFATHKVTKDNSTIEVLYYLLK